eukprot:GHVH01009752.1.p2 GENE.GHVH01009752.1~~GHVH01009752.1.p2  ORF type:complete len:546 (-),score=51.19 GHVH01009752.1:4678-6315(-)
MSKNVITVDRPRTLVLTPKITQNESLVDENTKLEDIEDLGELLSSIDFSDDCGDEFLQLKHPIELLNKRNMLSVTDFSAQVWCEEQIIQRALHGKAPETVPMLQGTARHEVLELEDHDVKIVNVCDREEGLAFRLLNSINLIDKLVGTGRIRELWILGKHHCSYPSRIPFGVVDGNGVAIGIRGVIDDVSIISDGGPFSGASLSLLGSSVHEWQTYWRQHRCCTVLGDTKTRREEVEPPVAQKLTSAIQLQTYHLLVNQLRGRECNGRELLSVYGVDGDRTIDHPDMDDQFNNRTLCEIMDAFLHSFECLPPLVDHAEVIYDCKGEIFATNSIPCDDSTIAGQIEYLLSFWTGAREKVDTPEGFERWKCKRCFYLPSCNKTTLQGSEKEEALKNRLDRLSSDRTAKPCNSMQCHAMSKPQRVDFVGFPVEFGCVLPEWICDQEEMSSRVILGGGSGVKHGQPFVMCNYELRQLPGMQKFRDLKHTEKRMNDYCNRTRQGRLLGSCERRCVGGTLLKTAGPGTSTIPIASPGWTSVKSITPNMVPP